MKIDLPAHPTSASLARAAVRQACDGVEVDLHAVLLCASELVTNAVLHAEPPIELAVDIDGNRVRVEVRDGGRGVVRRRRPITPDTISGRGLDIVETLASAWGSESNATGKVTWFEIEPG